MNTNQSETNLEISDDNILYLQNLVINTEKFKDQVKIRLNDVNPVFTLLNDDKAALVLDDKNICEFNWTLLGQYFVDEDAPTDEQIIENKLLYNWAWAWIVVPDERSEQLKPYLDNIPENLSMLKNNFIKFNDPMIISYLFAYLMNELKLDYVYVTNYENKFSAFGLTNIEWKINPDPALENKLKDAKEEKLKKYAEKQKTAEEPVFDWQKILSLYKNMYPESDTPDLSEDLEQLKKDLSL